MLKLQVPMAIKFTPTAVNSPSVTMEKGACRIRSPRDRATSYSTTSAVPPSTTNVLTTYTILLLILLASGAISCFGAAYYLFSTRWATPAFRRPSNHWTDKGSQALAFDPPSELDTSRNDPHEKFLAYLPHSGFHNQRIAFENALTLSRLLNRTLLVYPVRLGNLPLRYMKYDNLGKALSLSDKEGLYHCVNVPLHTTRPAECLDYFEYTYVPWEWLVNLTEIKRHQRLLLRWNMSTTWTQSQLGISGAEILTLRDLDAYQFRFLDSLDDVSPFRHKYKESVYIPELARSNHRLIQIGTLFGSSRLRLKSPQSIQIRTEIRRNMAFSNPILVEAANSIAQAMGHSYLGAHLRVGDGEFLQSSRENARLVWRKLVCNVLKIRAEDAVVLEAVFDEVDFMPPPLSTGSIAQWYQHVPFAQLEPPYLAAGCRGQLHSTPHLKPLNIPLFISTDAKDPLSHPSISWFLRTFPCSFFLNDFPSHTASLNRLRSSYDGVALKPFLEPFLDAMVAGKASIVVGTEGSTFSRFVEDVLWKVYHGLDIAQRG